MNNSQQVSRVSHITKPYLITTVAAFLTLFISTSVQGSYTYTTLDVPGASSTHAYGIDGNNIVGYYIDGSGNSHGFLTTIPEPSTALLLCLGLMALATGRRNR